MANNTDTRMGPVLQLVCPHCGADYWDNAYVDAPIRMRCECSDCGKEFGLKVEVVPHIP